MDNLRGFADGHGLTPGDAPDYVSYDDDDAEVALPPTFGDERRMQVRAYNFWTELLGENSLPSIEDLNPEAIEDFSEFSVLLDFTSGMENPAIAYVGSALMAECDIDDSFLRIDDVPARSLLSRITDHYLQIIANRAPIGFEAEFVNQRNQTIMYRGILLPFSSDDDTIDFIYGVINWKEAAPAALADELALEMRQALAPDTLPAVRARLEAYADGPLSQASVDPAAGGAKPEGSAVAPAELTADDGLADWLAAARQSADDACAADVRGRAALYAAIGRAHDFAVIAARYPQDYAALLDDSGIAVQDRAPMTPVVKLVFGANYDKTRLTEFASVLGYARRYGLGIGELTPVLERQQGGLKAIIAEERALRRSGDGSVNAARRRDPRDRLRKAPARQLADFAGHDSEFMVLVARRDADGAMILIGAVDADAGFTEKALRKTVV